MKKICFIIPYFGKFPNYFQLFLKTCASNTNYDWLIFTDDNTEYIYPSNVKRIFTSFEDVKKVFASKFNFKLALDSPYKLCDFKPTYGYVFEDYLKDYLFWGHCDVDTLMGNLDDYLTDNFLSMYDKIFALGHMTLYRNTYENNRVFMRTYKGRCLYKEYLSNPNICVFDEDCKTEYNIHNLFKSEGKRVFDGDFSLNFDVSILKFNRICYIGLQKFPLSYGHMHIKEKGKNIYFWNKGSIENYNINAHRVVKKTYLYVHFQMRRMYMMPDVQNVDVIRFAPNVFSKEKYIIDEKYLQVVSPWVTYPGFFKTICSYSWKNFRHTIGNLIRKFK